jgi:hypothetical protein
MKRVAHSITLEERIRGFASKAMLDLAEILPKSENGVIAKLQDIRIRERRMAEDESRRTRRPINASIAIKRIVLFAPYEQEHFESVCNSLKRACSGDRAFGARVDGIRDSYQKLISGGWHYLGTFHSARDTSNSMLSTALSSLPPGISRMHISHHRILPSIACLEAHFEIAEDLQHEINSIAEAECSAATIASSILPYPFRRGWQFRVNGREFEVSRRLTQFALLAMSWLQKELNLTTLDQLVPRVYPIYSLNFVDEQPRIREFLESCRPWMSRYGYNGAYQVGYFSSSDDVVFCSPPSNGRHPAISPLFCWSDKQLPLTTRNDLISGIASLSSFDVFLSYWLDELNECRAKLGARLIARRNILGGADKSVYRVKRLLFRTGRFKYEWATYKQLSVWKLQAANLLTYDEERKESLAKIVEQGIDRFVESLHSNADFIDRAMGDRLLIENIHVMHKLQQRMFWLTIIATIATIVGVAIGVENSGHNVMAGVGGRMVDFLEKIVGLLAQRWQ